MSELANPMDFRRKIGGEGSGGALRSNTRQTKSGPPREVPSRLPGLPPSNGLIIPASMASRMIRDTLAALPTSTPKRSLSEVFVTGSRFT